MSREEKFKKLNKILNKAIKSIESEYMQFQSVGLVDGFFERVYAYELYHRLRVGQNNDNDFTIHAEPQKMRTKFFKCILERLKSEKNENEDEEEFQKRVMPDILVHEPTNVNENIAIIEIKPEKGNIPTGYKKDIRVLKEFIDGGEDVKGYYRGISLLFSANNNSTIKDIKSTYSGIIKEVLGDDWGNYSEKIQLLWHEKIDKTPDAIKWWK